MKFAFLLLCPFLLLLQSGCGLKSSADHPKKTKGLSALNSADTDFGSEQEPSSFFLQLSESDTWRTNYYFTHLRKKIFFGMPGGIPETEYDLPVVLNDRVQRFLVYFQGPGRKVFNKWLARSGKYIPAMKEILEKRDLPTDLVYLAMIESGFNIKARSRRGAVGPWQFMRSTAKRYGLRVDYWIDERMDPVKSTVAAADYLSDLYEMFQDWELAAAGYNAGERRVQRAMSRTNSSDFWKLRGSALPRETKNYVPKLIAALIIAKNPERYGFTGIEYQDPEPVETVAVPSRKSLRDIAKVISLSYRVLQELNPSLIAGSTPPGGHFEINVPPGYGDIVSRKSKEIASLKNVQRATYRVKRGDTLIGISHRFHVSVSSIRDANGIRGSLIRAGQVLKIPRSYAGAHNTSRAGKKNKSQNSGNGKLKSGKKYVVRKGDNPYDIARAHNISVTSLLKHNGKKNPRRLQIGEVLYIPAEKSHHSAASSKKEIEYIVKRGDTLWNIAAKYRVPLSELKRWNKMSSDKLVAGDSLKIYIN